MSLSARPIPFTVAVDTEMPFDDYLRMLKRQAQLPAASSSRSILSYADIAVTIGTKGLEVLARYEAYRQSSAVKCHADDACIDDAFTFLFRSMTIIYEIVMPKKDELPTEAAAKKYNQEVQTWNSLKKYAGALCDALELLTEKLLPELHAQHMNDIKARAAERQRILDKQFESASEKGQSVGYIKGTPDALLDEKQLQEINDSRCQDILPPTELLEGALSEFYDMDEMSEFLSDVASASNLSFSEKATPGPAEKGTSCCNEGSSHVDPSNIEDPEMRAYEIRRQRLLGLGNKSNPLISGLNTLGINSNTEPKPSPPAQPPAHRPTSVAIPDPPGHLNAEEKHKWRQQYLIQANGADSFLSHINAIGTARPNVQKTDVPPLPTTDAGTNLQYQSFADRLDAMQMEAAHTNNKTSPDISVPLPPPPAYSLPEYPIASPPLFVSSDTDGKQNTNVSMLPPPSQPTHIAQTCTQTTLPNADDAPPVPQGCNPILSFNFNRDDNSQKPTATPPAPVLRGAPSGKVPSVSSDHLNKMKAMADHEQELIARVQQLQEQEQRQREQNARLQQQTEVANRNAAAEVEKARLQKEIQEVERQLEEEKQRLKQKKDAEALALQQQAEAHRRMYEKRKEMEEVARQKARQSKTVLLPVPRNDNPQLRAQSLRYWQFPRYQPSASDQGRRGLVNLGNTCYINSVLQCLAATPLGQYFQSDAYLDKIVDRYTGGGRIANSITFIFRELRLKGVPHPVSASNLKRWIAKKNDQFDNNSQQDASEFLRTLIEGLHDDLNAKAKVKVPYREIENSKRSDRLIAADYMKAFSDRNESFIVQTMNFFERSTIVCKSCGNASRSFTPTTSLDLAIPTPQQSQPGIAGVSIQDCLSMYIRPELLTNDSRLKCSACNMTSDAVKQLSIWAPPKILVLTLKRFKAWGNFSDKIAREVAFQPEIDLSPYCYGGGVMDDAELGQKCIYDLVGVVNHQGNLNGGHYTADTKGFVDSKWFYFSDETTNLSTQASFQKAYILFYVRRRIPPR